MHIINIYFFKLSAAQVVTHLHKEMLLLHQAGLPDKEDRDKVRIGDDLTDVRQVPLVEMLLRPWQPEYEYFRQHSAMVKVLLHKNLCITRTLFIYLFFIHEIM